MRIREDEEETVSSEFSHVILVAIPPLNVIGVYLETNTKEDAADAVQKVLVDKVQRCVDRGGNCVVGHTNAAVNKNTQKKNPSN